MTPEEARDALKPLCAWDKAPALSEDDLDAILLRSRLVDSSGRKPGADDYEGTYDLNLSAQRAWEMKAGNAAHCTDFKSDGEDRSRSQLMSHCMEMAKLYRGKRAASLPGALIDGRLPNGLYPWQIANGPSCGCD